MLLHGISNSHSLLLTDLVYRNNNLSEIQQICLKWPDDKLINKLVCYLLLFTLCWSTQMSRRLVY